MNEITPKTKTLPEDQQAFEDLKRSVREACDAADRCVRFYPWTSVGLAALAGMIAGLIMSGDD